MKLSLIIPSLAVVAIVGCSSNNNVCEDVTLASEQIQQCQALHRQIINAKGQPLIRTELERRYEKDCINIRYYRDEKQPAICGNKQRVDKLRETAKDVAKQ